VYYQGEWYAFLSNELDPAALPASHMVYRGLYYFGQAYLRGEAQDPVIYLADNAQWLGLIKRRRKQPAFLFPSLTNRSGP